MEARGPQLTLDLFPIQAPCQRLQNWYLDLYIALRVALGIDPAFDAGIGGGARTRTSPPWEGVEGELIGGIRIAGTKKRSLGEVIQVEYALFTPEGRCIAWCGSLDDGYPTPLHDLLFRRANGEALVLDPALKARIKTLKAASKSKAQAPAAGPFEAEFPLRAVAVAPGVVAAADMKSNLYLWEGTSGALRARAKAGAGGMKSIHQIAFSPDASRVAVGAGTITVFDVATGKPALKLAGHPKGEVWGIQYSPDGRFIATASRGPRGSDNSVALWDASSGEQVHRWPYATPGASCTWLAFTPDGASLVFLVERPAILHRIDLASREVVARSELGTSADALAWSKGGWTMVIDGELVGCDETSLAPRCRVPFPMAAGARLHVVATPDGAHVVAGRRHLGVFDPETLTLRRALDENVEDTYAVATDGARVLVTRGVRVLLQPL